MLVPAVRGWAERHGRAASRFLIPLSYATILGGAITAIGTSTNLVLGGLLQSVGQDELEMFELARFGLPLAGAGLLLTVVAAPWLLPDRRDPEAAGAGPFLSGVDVCGGAGGVRRAVGGGRGAAPSPRGVPGGGGAPGHGYRAGGPHVRAPGRRPTHVRRAGGLGARPPSHVRAGLSRGSPFGGGGLRRPHVLRGGGGGGVSPQRADAGRGRVSGALSGRSGGYPPLRGTGGGQIRPSAAAGRRHPCWSWPPTASTSGGATTTTSCWCRDWVVRRQGPVGGHRWHWPQ